MAMREQAGEIAALMGLMANESRLLILCALLERPMTVGELAGQAGKITGPALSQHLHKLRDAGLIQAQKEGQFVRYSLKDERIRSLMAVLKKAYCKEGPGTEGQAPPTEN